MRQQIDGKVSPDMVETISLIEISEKLSALLSFLENQVPDGVPFSDNFTADTLAHKVVILYSATIYNDGAADIYILDADRAIASGSDTPLQSSDRLEIDMKRRTAKVFYVKTLTGTAAVRVLALR